MAAVTSGGWSGWAADLVSRIAALRASGHEPDGLLIYLPGGLNGNLSQVFGLPFDNHATLGSSACATALASLRDSIALRVGLVVYSGPVSDVQSGLVVDINLAAAPFKNLGGSVRVVVDGAGLYGTPEFTTIDTAFGQTCGIEGMAAVTIPTQARNRLSVQICSDGVAPPWDPQTYTGGPTGNIRPGDLANLGEYGGEIISQDNINTGDGALLLTRALLCWDLRMSISLPLYLWESFGWSKGLFPGPKDIVLL